MQNFIVAKLNGFTVPTCEMVSDQLADLLNVSDSVTVSNM